MNYTLDLATWRSGGNGEHATGVGKTKLRNARGYD